MEKKSSLFFTQDFDEQASIQKKRIDRYIVAPQVIIKIRGKLIEAFPDSGFFPFTLLGQHAPMKVHPHELS